MTKPWKMGFVGAATDNFSRWVEEQCQNLQIQRLAIPFFGSGKEVGLLGQNPDMTIESWDVQHISALVADMFTSPEVKTNIYQPKMQKGWTFENRPFPEMSDQTAGLIDYIANNGTNYECLALVTAIARSTIMGRIDQWDPEKQGAFLWQMFEKRKVIQEDYINLPANITHHEQDFYSAPPEDEFDAVYIDPPKIISSTDIYSKQFVALNRMVSPDGIEIPELDKWTKYDYPGKLRTIIENTKSTYIILAYTSGVSPGISTIKDLFQEHGELIDEARHLHRRRYDYGLVFKRAT